MLPSSPHDESIDSALGELKTLIEGSRRVDGKLSATTIRKAEKHLKDAV